MNNSHPWRDETLLRMYYNGFGLSASKISFILDCSSQTVYKWMDKHGIERRSFDELPTPEHDPKEDKATPWRVRPFLKLMYEHFELSTRDIAWLYDTSKATITRWLDKHDIEKRKSNREKSPCFYEDGDGYMTCHHYDGEEYQRFYTHRLLAVAEYGYEEVSDNIVHHITGHPLDNRIQNLEVIPPKEHKKRHYTYDLDYQRGLPE